MLPTIPTVTATSSQSSEKCIGQPISVTARTAQANSAMTPPAGSGQPDRRHTRADKTHAGGHRNRERGLGACSVGSYACTLVASWIDHLPDDNTFPGRHA